MKHAVIEVELNWSKKFIDIVPYEHRLPSQSEITKLLKQGYLLIANVNSRMLNTRPGYTGHFVVIKGCGKTHLVLHDPGSPGTENRHVSFSHFQKAWEYPDQNARNVIAVRR